MSDGDVTRRPVFGLLCIAVSLCASAGCGNAPEAAPARESGTPLRTDVHWQNDVSLEGLIGSVHAELDCSECHVGPAGDAEQEPVEVQCRGCHEQAATVYDGSVHGQAYSDGESLAPRCQDCHGAHDVHEVDDPQSLVSKRLLASTCARCHDNPAVAEQRGREEHAVGHYVESIHGQKLLKSGTVVAPSCVDCHGGHEIAAVEDPESKVSRVNVVSTCGECHEGIARKFSKDVHGLALERELLAADQEELPPEAPVCTSCHTAHTIDAVATTFKLASDERCGKCHEKRLQQHLGTYHGRAHALGGADVAACFDCHGSHGILASDDPASKLSTANKLGTCRSCHEDAPAQFAGYFAHGDSSDGDSYPQLFWTARLFSILLWAAVALLGLHTLLWFLRWLMAVLTNPRDYLLARRRALPPPARDAIRGIDHFCHRLLLASFAVLLATGMPLRFHEQPWARMAFAFVGGADAARVLHKIGAVLTLACVAIHVASLMGPLWHQRSAFTDGRGRVRLRLLAKHVLRPDSALLHRGDLNAFWQHVRWFLGRGPQPSFGPYGYWEKLDYLALVFGVAIIAITGLITWMPEGFTRLAPGWLVNVAQTVHGGQAVVVATSLLVAHLFHLWPKKLAASAARRSNRSSIVRAAPAPADFNAASAGSGYRSPQT